MRPSSLTTIFGLAAMAAFTALSAVPAFAECKRFGFTVNDYGKDGPTADAKSLLDKLIAQKMAERGVATYTTGKKDVKCDLFLDFIVFDEHTCTAEATVCWGGSALPKSQQAGKTGASNQTTGSIDKPKAAKKSAPKAAETSPPAISQPEETSASSPANEPAVAHEAPAAAQDPAEAPPTIEPIEQPAATEAPSDSSAQ